MLQTFRKNLTSIFGIFVLILVGLLMLGFGVGTPGGGGAAPQVIAKVGDVEITYLDYQRQLQGIRSRERARLGTNFNQMEKFLNLEQQALDSLIQETVTDSFARDLGLTASVKDIEDQLTQAGVNRATFDAFRRSQGLSELQVEELMRTQLIRTQLGSFFGDGSEPSALEVKAVFEQNNTQKKFIFARISRESSKEAVDVSDEEALKAYFSENLERFRKPSKTRFQFVVFKNSDFEKEVDVLPEDIEQAYRENRRNFRTPHRVQLRQIMISKGEGDENRKKAEEILKKLEEGEPFAELARASSEDEATKNNGGDIGWSELNALEPSFKQAVVNLAPGEFQ